MVMQWSRINRFGAIASVSLMLLMGFLPTVSAGTVLTDNTGDFSSGTLANVSAGPNGLSLSMNQTFKNDWTLRENGTSAPSERAYHAMAYDNIRREVILFGGEGPTSSYYADTWSYNLSTNKWTNMKPSNPPSARCSHMMAFDEVNGVAVLYGGWYPNKGTSDTWKYNLSSNTWTYMNPSNPPPTRYGGAMAYDNYRDVFVLFGGRDENPPVSRGDTWTYNLTTNTWTNKNPSSPPGARSAADMVFDEDTKEMILIGNAAYNDTWAYNLTTNAWTNLLPVNKPPSQNYPRMIYDSINKEIFLFSGWGNDTWIYRRDLNNWTKKNVPHAPSLRVAPDMVYEPDNGQVILFGGITTTSPWPLLNDTWIFNYTKYNDIGEYTSLPINLNGTAYFGNITWTAETSIKTNIRLKIRSADTGPGLSGKTFLGPDGTGVTYYSTSGQRVNKKHNGSKWFQYRVYFDTTDPYVTPLLKEVRIHYNLAQNLTLLSPLGGEDWTGGHNITWNASDPDKDSLNFTIRLESNSSAQTLAEGLTGHSWQWNTTNTLNGTYRIRIIAMDNNISIPLSVNQSSDWFKIQHPRGNSKPNATLLTPLNNAVVNTTTVNLQWSGKDNDNDTLSYYVRFDKVNGGTVIAHQNDTSYNVSGLEDNKTYFWTVIPNDGRVNGSAPAIRKFLVVLPPPNHPPVITSTPVTDAIALLKYIYQVNASDLDVGDNLTFSLDTNPLGMTIGAKTGLIEWTPTVAQKGQHPVVVRVDDGTDNDTQAFNVTVKVPTSYPPQVTLISPKLGAEVNLTTPVLSWSVSDPDSNIFTFDIYLGTDNAKVSSKDPTVKVGNAISSTSFIPGAQLSKGSTYYWLVIPSDGTNTGTCLNGTWWFKVSNTAMVKHAPVITSIPITSAIVGENYKYIVKATDEDTGDSLTFSFIQYPVNMSINPGTGLITWTPTGDQIGVNPVIIKVSDGMLFVSQKFDITVTKRIVNNRPIITAIQDQKTKVGKEFTYIVHADDTDIADSLSFTLKQGPQGMTINLSTGLINWLPTKADIGKHTVFVNVTDGRGGYDEQSFSITVEKKAAPPRTMLDNPWLIILLIILIIAVVGIVIAVARRKKTVEPESPSAPKLKKEKVSASSEMVSAEALTTPTTPAIIPVKKESTTVIDDIFMIYKDGRLISHHTRHLKPDMDDEVLGGMFTAVQEFMKTSFGGDEEKAVSEITYGDSKILIEHGRHLFIAAVISGEGTKEMHENMKIAVHNIEAEFGNVLESWSGDVGELKQSKKWIKKLISGEPIEKIEPIVPQAVLSPPIKERPVHKAVSKPIPREIPEPASAPKVIIKSPEPEEVVTPPEPEPPTELGPEPSTRYAKNLILETLSSLPRGLPSELLGPSMDELASNIANAEYAKTPEGIDIVLVDGDWYYGNPHKVGKYLQKYKGEVIRDNDKKRKLAQFNVETERKAGESEVDVKGKKS